MASEPSLRRLGPMELYSSSRHHLGIYRAVCVSARYVPRPCTTGPSSPRFIAALAAVVRAHPMLRVGIAGEDSNAACYTHIPRINLQEHIHLVIMQCGSEEQLNNEVARVQAAQHNHLWESTVTKPPWRVTIIQDQDRDCDDIIFSFHHALMDGTSGRLFHSHLLAALSSPYPPSANDGPLLSFPDPPVLPAPQEAVVPFTLGPLYMASVLWGEFAPAMLRPAPRYPWGGAQIDFARPHVTRIRAVDVPPQQTEALLAACRANDTTLTGLLHALILAYFGTTLPEHAAAPGFCGATPMGLRSHACDASAADALRVLLCSTEHFFSGDDVVTMRAAADADTTLLTTAVWATAARVRRELATRSKNLTHNNVAALMKHVSDWRIFHARRDGTARTHSWEVSNVGVLGARAAAGDDAEVRISRILLSNGAMVTGAAVGINVASTRQGQLGIALSWQEGIVEESVVEGLGRVLERGIERFCTTGEWIFGSEETDEMDAADRTNRIDQMV
ncbi:Alcohol acetyltransferase [Beauveria brongniartii RCEF 3172]|uniref:Alcohol acetyltransferase n=1 Tax=Beauveria brongniartii RCEF 3172 TaxID=1081107 RepID=A0A166X5U3_9HYPO|nr:Alcohol acetyltransferase [Beauveria brongniartii RCEF 3172]